MFPRRGMHRLEASRRARALVRTSRETRYVRPRPRASKIRDEEKERERERGERRLVRMHPAEEKRCTVATLENAFPALCNFVHAA